MKSYALLLTALLLTTFTFAQQPATSDDVLKAACQKAGREKKNVMIIFHASWCVWCHRMDTAMNDAACKEAFSHNYVVEHLTVQESKDKKALENPGAMEMLSKYGGDNQGIPFFLIFDPKGHLLADSKIRDEQHPQGANMGCPTEDGEVAAFTALLKKTSKMNDKELAAIADRFKKIKALH